MRGREGGPPGGRETVNLGAGILPAPATLLRKYAKIPRWMNKSLDVFLSHNSPAAAACRSASCPRKRSCAKGDLVKKRSTKKLTLSRETLKNLEGNHLAAIAGRDWPTTPRTWKTCETCACSIQYCTVTECT